VPERIVSALDDHLPTTARRLARTLLARLRDLGSRSPRLVLGGALALAIGTAGATAWWLWPRAGRATAAFRRGHTREARVERRDVEDVFLLTREVRAVRSLEINTPQTESWQLQIKWLAEDGAEVREGDPVVELDSTSVVQNLEETRLRLTQAEIERAGRERTVGAEREKRRAAVTLAETEVEKARLEADLPLELLSRRDWHRKQTALHEREAQLAKARAELDLFQETSRAEAENSRLACEKASRKLAQGERTLTLLSVRAPRTGFFLVARNWQEDRKLQAGDSVFPGMAVASIPDLAEMEVLAQLAAVDEGALAIGAPVRAVLDTYPERLFAGRVAAVATVAREEYERGGFDVRVALAQSDPQLLRPGMSVRIEVVRRRWPQALAVPRGAVTWHEDRAVVRLPGDREREVRLEACLATECVVASGLSEGERVAL
jgi:HlyD family secretion protein